MRLLSLSETSIQPRTSFPSSILARQRGQHRAERRRKVVRLGLKYARVYFYYALGRFCQILANFGKLWQILEGSFSAVSTFLITRVGAFSGFSSIYKICILLHRFKKQKVNNMSWFCWNYLFFAKFWKIRRNSATSGKVLLKCWVWSGAKVQIL